MPESSPAELYIGIDFGGTNIRACLARSDGQLLQRLRRPTAAGDGPERVTADIASSVGQLAAMANVEVRGVGVAAPGPLDHNSGTVLQAPNLPGWEGYPLRAALESATGLTVQIGNDANLAALAEYHFGAGRGIDDFVYLNLGTGVGGGVIANGQLLLGQRGLAAELGHIVVNPNGALCGCGNCGCLEAYAAGSGIAREARERLAAGGASALLMDGLSDPGQLTAKRVIAAARAGDDLANAVLRQAATYLGIGLTSIIHSFDPEMIVFGGGLINALDLLLPTAKEELRQRAMLPYRGFDSFVTAKLGDDAGLYGAIAYARHQTNKRVRR